MPVTVRPETLADRQAIGDVNRAAFATDAEANLVDELRAGGYSQVSLVAEVDRQIVGHILFSQLHIATSGGKMSALSLAPMAVIPAYQRQGFGSKLVVDGIAACRNQGHRIATVLGHPSFYPRFGFDADLAKSLESPFGSGEAWMALELVSGSLAGVIGQVEYPPPFTVFT